MSKEEIVKDPIVVNLSNKQSDITISAFSGIESPASLIIDVISVKLVKPVGNTIRIKDQDDNPDDDRTHVKLEDAIDGLVVKGIVIHATAKKYQARLILSQKGVMLGNPVEIENNKFDGVSDFFRIFKFS